MSGLTDFKSMECLVSDCPEYNSDIPFAYFTIVIDFYPLFLTLGILLLSFRVNELYYTLVSYALTVDFGVSVLLQSVVFRQPGQFPGCGHTYEMPSFSSQQITVFQTMMVMWMIVWGKKIYYKQMTLLQLINYLVLFSRVYIGINTREELIVGQVFGLLVGMICFCIVYYCIYPYFASILKWALVEWCGFTDTLCGTMKKKKYKYTIVPNTEKAL